MFKRSVEKENKNVLSLEDEVIERYEVVVEAKLTPTFTNDEQQTYRVISSSGLSLEKQLQWANEFVQRIGYQLASEQASISYVVTDDNGNELRGVLSLRNVETAHVERSIHTRKIADNK